MPDPEKVIKGLEICSSGEWNSTGGRDHTSCPYYPAGYTGCTCKLLMRDALALLKAQEPVKPRVGHDGWYRCGGCNNPLASVERVKNFYGHPWPKYCEECGMAVKWE